ncbi:MAG: TIGR00730 family Rossman fold protein [Pseudomonadota bacterium]
MRRTVCAFSGATSGNRAEYSPAAIELGEYLAKNNFRLVYGGANTGLMGQLADAALRRDGEVVGVLPEKLASLELAHAGLSELKIVESMHERKQLMAALSDSFIALPGGIGTLEENFEVWTWTQLGIHSKPIGFLNVSGFFDGLEVFLDHLVIEGFLTPFHRSLAFFEPDPQSLVRALQEVDTRYVPKWDTSHDALG